MSSGYTSSRGLTGKDDHGGPKGYSRGHLEGSHRRGRGMGFGEVRMSNSQPLSSCPGGATRRQAEALTIFEGHVKGDMVLKLPSAG